MPKMKAKPVLAKPGQALIDSALGKGQRDNNKGLKRMPEPKLAYLTPFGLQLSSHTST